MRCDAYFVAGRSTVAVVRKLLRVLEQEDAISDFIERGTIVRPCDSSRCLLLMVDRALYSDGTRCYIPVLFGDPRVDERRLWR